MSGKEELNIYETVYLFRIELEKIVWIYLILFLNRLVLFIILINFFVFHPYSLNRVILLGVTDSLKILKINLLDKYENKLNCCFNSFYGDKDGLKHHKSIKNQVHLIQKAINQNSQFWAIVTIIRWLDSLSDWKNIVWNYQGTIETR